MTRQEFLQELRLALQGQLSQAAINENVRYYDSYIMEEIRKGGSEEAVISRLGSPRLIAKTLIDTADSFGNASGGRYYSDSYGHTEPEGKACQSDSGDGRPRRSLRLGSWSGKLLLLAAVILLIVAAILIITVAANVIAFLLPILVPIIIIFLIYSLFFGNRR